VQVTAPSDAGATFQWKKDGEVVSGALSASLTLPTDLAEGKYTYIRYAKKPDCPDAVASNAFTVEVLNCGDIVANDPIGKKGTITDARDDKVYKIVKMPDGKVWMAENLNYQKGLTFNARADQANGKPLISTATGVPAIGSFWCPQLAGTAGSVTTSVNTCNVYGALYTWETVMSKDGVSTGLWVEALVESNYVPVGTSPSVASANVNNAEDNGRGICPAGFRVPTEYEWAHLFDVIENNTDFTTQEGSNWLGTQCGYMLKSSGTYVGADQGEGLWSDQPARGVDAFGFSAIPAGYINSTLKFDRRGLFAMFWTSTPVAVNMAWHRGFSNGQRGSTRYQEYRGEALSIRCMRN
jgi:uncharacterized protein (TIGR02145 family)